MTHCTDGTLRAYADGELAPGVRVRLERHLAACTACRAQLEAITADAAWAGGLLRDQAAAGDGATEVALRRWRAVADVRRRPVSAGDGADRLRGGGADQSRPARARRRVALAPWLAPAAAACVLVGVLTAVPPVRAMAGDFLQLFRVQQVQVLTVSDTDASQLEAMLKSQGPALLDIKNLAKVRVAPSPAPVVVPLAEAAQQLPFAPRVPTPAPAGYVLAETRVQPQFHVEITDLNVARINALLKSLGSQEQLPAALGGADITLMVPASLALTYQGPAGQAPIHVLEGGNPALGVSARGVDVNTVRDVLLDLPFLPDDLRAQLRAISDWQHTALIPQVSGVSEAVPVDGTEGAFVHTGDQAGDSALIWLSGEVVYAIEGPLDVSGAQALAASLR